MNLKQMSIVALSGLALGGAWLVPAQANESSASPAAKLGLFPSPKKNQSEKQQLKDEKACYNKAQEKAQAAVNSQPAQPSPTTPPGHTARTAARGAAGGAAIGAIAGSPGTGAAAGAAAGAVRGRRQRMAGEAQAEQQAAEQVQAAQDAVKRAFTACMEPRGYSVK